MTTNIDRAVKLLYDWPGGICQTCQDQFNCENTQLQEGHP